MTTSEHRQFISIGTKLHACLLALGFSDDEIKGGIDWHHSPSLGLREINSDTGEMHPRPNDPHHIIPMRRAAHAIQTNGTPATSAGSDKHAIAHARRLTKKQEAFRQRLLAKDAGEPKPKSKWQSRKFETKGKNRWNRAAT